MIWRIVEGDCCVVLPTLPAESVQTCITSPPYWGLRDYDHADQLGLERTPDEYVACMVEVFREVRRVLRPDGTLWLNLGDSYAANNWIGNREDETSGLNCIRPGYVPPRHDGRLDTRDRKKAVPPGLKPKDLVGVPWRVAFALQADGWWLRSDIVWAKPNPMPESVTDRPTKAHEYLFLMAKSERYFYDADAVRERALPGARLFNGGHGGNGDRQDNGRQDVTEICERNRRSVWTISTKPFAGAHFAVMPWDLVEPCVLAGSRPGDTVLDPFAGTGTVGMVARRHSRRFVGIEINPAYAAMARERIADDAPLFNGQNVDPPEETDALSEATLFP